MYSIFFVYFHGYAISRKIKYGDICQFIRNTCLFASMVMEYWIHHRPIQTSIMHN